MDDVPAVSIENLSLRFEGRTVLENFSISVAAGENVTLTGRSGSGKSSVLRCLMGFAIPATGTVSLFGEEVDGHTIWHLRRRVAYVAQEPVLGEGTVGDALARPFAYAANRHLARNLEGAPELMERFGLPKGTSEHQISKLSGGEKQRVAIVSAVLLDRELFLLDEPASALDAESRDAVLEFFASRPELTVLAVSHAPQGFDLDGRTVTLTGGEPEDA